MKKWYDSINEDISVEENYVLLKFLHPIDPSVYLHWPSIDNKCWVPVIQLLLIIIVNTSGRPYTSLKSEFKDTQKQFTENHWTWKHSFMRLPIELSFNFKQFDHHWKLLKTFEGLLVFVLPGYFNEFLYEITKWNTSTIKPHLWSIKLVSILNTLGANKWKPVLLGDLLRKKVIFITGMPFFLLLHPESEFLLKFWTINAHNNEECTIKHWEKILC